MPIDRPHITRSQDPKLDAVEAERRALIEALVEWSTDPASAMDREALRNVKQIAWRT